MEIRTVSRPSCLLCGNQGDFLYKNLQDFLFKAPGKWHIRRCGNAECGLCWLDPVANEADLQFLYENYPTHDNSAHDEISSFLGLQAKLRAFLLNCYRIATLIPSSILGLDKERQQLLNMFLDDLSPGRVLDVGCGAGDFLNRMRQTGWSVAGVDFDGKAIAHAKSKYGLDLLQSDLAGAHFPDNSFDAVTMNHVIEHVPEPVTLFTEVRRVLKPGGRLVAITPNAQSLGHSLFQDCWRGLEPPRHLQIFPLNALRDCARQASFKVLEAKSSAANADIIIGASFGIREAKSKMVDSKAEQEINIVRSLRACFVQYREAFLVRKRLDFGEEAVLICQK